MKDKAINNSTSIEIMRSQIDFADYNPRKIDAEAKKRLRNGLKTFGLVGGIVVNKNENTGRFTLIGGHQRISVLDDLKGYPKKDYSIRVEAVCLSDKEEKELNVLLNNPCAQGEWDYDLLSDIVHEIDYEVAGLTDADLAFLEIPDVDTDWTPNGGVAGFVDLKTLEMPPVSPRDPARYESEKARLAEEKRKTNEKAEAEALNHSAYICLSFRDFRAKEMFCQRFGIPPHETYINGEDFGDVIERID